MSRLTVAVRISPDGPAFTVSGCDAWALLELYKAGARGCTPICIPGPRWGAYVHALRTECRLETETIHEPHAGPFLGTHARYVLESALEFLCRSDALKQEAA